MALRVLIALALPLCLRALRSPPPALLQTQVSLTQGQRQGRLGSLRRWRQRHRSVEGDKIQEIIDGTGQDDIPSDFDPFAILWKAAQKGASAAAKATVVPLAIPLAGGALITGSALTGVAAAMTAPVIAPVVAAGTAVAGAGASSGAAGVASAIAATKTAQALIDESDPDVGVDMEELVPRRGYLIERHRVITADGYVLGVYRIPHGRMDGAKGGRRPVVLLQHGVLDSSLAFVANFADQSLAYILADAGYDVWMGNNRGNRYSKAHVSLSPSSSEFWNFSYAEMAEYDLPAEVSYILQHTGEKRLAYVGHSEGSTQAFAALSTNRTLASQLSVFVAVAPVAYVGYQRVLFLKAAQGIGLDRLVHILGDGLFYMNVQTANALSPVSCRALSSGCSFLMELFAGKSEHLNQSRIHVYATMFPAGTSTKNVRHWVSSIKSHAFGKYDYEKENLRVYGTPKPPSYDLSSIDVPIALFSGGHDQMADPEDVARLKQDLKPGVVFKSMEVPTYAHLDFILAEDAKTLLYPEVLEALEQHKP